DVQHPLTHQGDGPSGNESAPDVPPPPGSRCIGHDQLLVPLGALDGLLVPVQAARPLPPRSVPERERLLTVPSAAPGAPPAKGGTGPENRGPLRRPGSGSGGQRRGPAAFGSTRAGSRGKGDAFPGAV